MDKLTDMQREMMAAGMVKKEDVDKYQENLSLDKYGTREMPTVSPLASDKPLQRAYKWFSAAESLANSGAPNLNFDNLVCKGTEHISMVETSHLGPESPRTEAERYSLGCRVSNWKKLVVGWKEEAANADRCAQRKLNLIEFVVQQGGDGDKIREEISVTCKQRGAEGGIDYFFHSQDGKRYRSNKEVCKKFLGITFGDDAAPRAPIGTSRRPTDADVSDARHVPNVLPDAFMEAEEWFRGVAREATEAMDQLDHERVAIFARDAGRHIRAVDIAFRTWPMVARGLIRGRLVKWEASYARWRATEAEIRRCPPKATLAYQQRVRELAEHAQASQQHYRAKQLKKRTCSMCGKTAPLSSRAFSYCSGCRHADVDRDERARYCSEACQRAHWLAGHADECPWDG